MIPLTKLNHQRFAVNPDLIKFMEQAPDTVLTLVTGEKLVILESSEVVLSRIIDFRRAITNLQSDLRKNPGESSG